MSVIIAELRVATVYRRVLEVPAFYYRRMLGYRARVIGRPAQVDAVAADRDCKESLKSNRVDYVVQALHVVHAIIAQRRLGQSFGKKT
jgi:hypothetical protein